MIFSRTFQTPKPPQTLLFLQQINFIFPRFSSLSRKDSLHQRKEHTIAANIDQVIITASVKEPSLKPSLLDRYIIAASIGNLTPILVINKLDLATTKELDESIVYGPGLRWSIMGMNQIYMMAGGKGGARHFIKQFGPALDWPWSHLKAPKLSEEIIKRFVDGTTLQADGKSISEMEKVRDECLVAIQRVLAKHDMGAGKTLNQYKDRLRKNLD